MRSRCYNQKNKHYKDYGGRGITVYEPWRTSFQDFLEHIGPKPGPGYSVDRMDNSRNYEPGNVRWATASEQTSNRRPWSEWQRRSAA